MDLNITSSGNIANNNRIMNILSSFLQHIERNENVSITDVSPVVFIQSVSESNDSVHDINPLQSLHPVAPLVSSPSTHGGWSKDRFLHQSIDDYICSICHDVCKDAMTLNCGHSFCQSCITRSESSFQNKCPECRTLSMHLVPDFSKRMKINGFTVTCTYKEFGCSTTDALSRIFTHEYTCSFMKKECLDCKTMLCDYQMEHHKKYDCVYRSHSCERCNESIRYIDYDHHMNVTCTKIEKTCIYCTWKGNQEQIKQHLEECPQLPIPCPYHTYGCQITVKRNMLKEHLFDHNHSHLELLCKTIKQKDTLWKQKLRSVQYDGPFRISSHSHIVVLCEDMKDAVCEECNKPIEEENQKWFAYYCTSGCRYCVCTECFPSLRIHKSRKHPNELLFSFS
jgi:hypothetical protein